MEDFISHYVSTILGSRATNGNSHDIIHTAERGLDLLRLRRLRGEFADFFRTIYAAVKDFKLFRETLQTDVSL